MSGAAVLEESEYLADSIGIVPVYGSVGFSDGRMRYCGIPRRARAPQQAYNYHVSEQLAYIGTAPKSPWLVTISLKHVNQACVRRPLLRVLFLSNVSTNHWAH